MKKTIILFLLISTSVFSQKVITLKSGETLNVKDCRLERKKVSYTTQDGKGNSISKKKVKSLKDLGLKNDEFEFNQLGLTPYVVKKIEDKTAGQLYNLTLKWIKETQRKPHKAIKVKIEGEKIRFKGTEKRGFCLNRFKNLCPEARYVIDISFKDGRYKFEPVSIYYHTQPSQYMMGGDTYIYLGEEARGTYYKRNGFIEREFKDLPMSVENLFNFLNNNLEQYVKSSKVELNGEKNDGSDW
ncbi:MAG: hypothetical protein KGV59_05875 [Tenacibaculum sp.]|nr:hypothetical protein [Tenacibaculum sp.]